MRSLPTQRGFTLIELLVSITIFVALVLLALPMYSEFIANSQIRNANENTLMGVRTAQTEAIKHNGQAQFILDPAVGWRVVLLEDGSTLQTYRYTEGASRTVVTPLPPNATAVTFTGLGRIMPANPDASLPITRINVTTSTSIANPRTMAVIIGAAGLKSCVSIAAIQAPDPQACP